MTDPTTDPAPVQAWRFVVVPAETTEGFEYRGHLTRAGEGAIWCQTVSRPAAKHIAEALNRFPPDDADPEEPF